MSRRRSTGADNGSDVVPSPAQDLAPARTRGTTRRTFLRAALVGTVVVAGGLVWRADDQGVFTPFEGPAFDAWRRSHATGTGALAAAAVLAASAHNMQNWQLHLTDSRVDLIDDVRRSLGVVDPYRREAHLGLGCALANLELACAPAGLSAQTTLTPSAADPDLVARLALTPAEARDDDPLFRAIRHRHSDRGAFPAEVPGADLLERLGQTATAGGTTASGSTGVEIRWLTDRSALDEAGALLVDSAQALIDDEAMSKDGFTWFRTSAAEIRRERDGLTLDCQALPTWTELFGKMLPPASRRRGDTTWVQMTRDVHTATARAYGLVMAPRHDVASAVSAGRSLQRLHLALTSEGWSMQHLNQAVEMAEREESTDRDPELTERLASLARSTGGTGGTGSAGGADVIAMVRVGRPSGRAALSPRRSPEAVLV